MRAEADLAVGAGTWIDTGATILDQVALEIHYVARSNGAEIKQNSHLVPAQRPVNSSDNIVYGSAEPSIGREHGSHLHAIAVTGYVDAASWSTKPRTIEIPNHTSRNDAVRDIINFDAKVGQNLFCETPGRDGSGTDARRTLKNDGGSCRSRQRYPAGRGVQARNSPGPKEISQIYIGPRTKRNRSGHRQRDLIGDPVVIGAGHDACRAIVADYFQS